MYPRGAKLPDFGCVIGDYLA